MPSDDELAEVTDDLYAVHPAEFVSARNELARRLRAEGRRDLATAVGKLRRPTPAAWAVNQLCRHDRGAVEDLVRRGEQLRVAQERALAGAPASELREATRARRDALVALADSAARFFAERGQAVDAHRQEISDTLDAASLDPQAARAALTCRLTSGLQPPSGFGELEGLSTESFGLAPTTAGEPAPPEVTDAERAARDARRRAEELQATAEASETRAERRRRELEEAEEEVARLERALDGARRRAELAAEDAEAARQAAAEARQAATRAAADRERAEAHLREVSGPS